MMNRCLISSLMVALLASVGRAQDDLPSPQPGPFKNSVDKSSYAIGLNFGTSIRARGVPVNTEELIKGIRHAFGSSDQSLLTEEQVRVEILSFERQAAEVEKKRGEEFLAANKKKPGVKALPSGLQYQVLKAGTGATPKISDRIRFHFRGTFRNGAGFGNSYDRGQPIVAPVAGVMRGWMDAFVRMKVGGKWKVVMPPELAQGGQAGQGGPNAVLIFELELLGIEK